MKDLLFPRIVRIDHEILLWKLSHVGLLSIFLGFSKHTYFVGRKLVEWYRGPVISKWHRKYNRNPPLLDRYSLLFIFYIAVLTVTVQERFHQECRLRDLSMFQFFVNTKLWHLKKINHFIFLTKLVILCWRYALDNWV